MFTQRRGGADLFSRRLIPRVVTALAGWNLIIPRVNTDPGFTRRRAALRSVDTRALALAH